MKVLYETVFGSKLYGTDNPNSDTDWKAIVLPTLDELLLGYRIKNSVKTTGSISEKNSKDDIDYERIPLQVFMDDFVKGQTYAMEIAYSALDSSTQEKTVFDESFVEICEQLLKRFFIANMQSMTGYAFGQAQKYGVKGERLKVLLEIKDVFVKGITKEGMLKEKLRKFHNLKHMDSVIDGKNVKKETYKSSNDSLDDCYNILGSIFPFDITVGEANGRLEAMIKKYGHRAHKASEDGAVDWKAVHHALRVSYQALDLLEGKPLIFPFVGQRKERLVEIKEGRCELKGVSDEIESVLDTINRLQEETLMRKERTPEFDKEFKEFKIEWLKKLYSLESYE